MNRNKCVVERETPDKSRNQIKYNEAAAGNY